MDSRRNTGLWGILLLTVGCFVPIVTVPIVGSMTYFKGGDGDGVFALGLAFLALLLLALKWYRLLLIVGLLALGLVAFDFLNTLVLLDRLRQEVGDNLFGAALAAGVHLDWGWIPLFLGAFLISGAGFIKKPAERVVPAEA